MSIDRKTPIPLYFQVAEQIRQSIRAGDYADGDKLPSEHNLCSEFDVSRSVIRQALLALTQDGLIVTERGRGAFVQKRKVPIAMTQKLDSLETGMIEAGFKLTTKVLQQKLIETTPEIQDKIQDKEAVFLQRLRYAENQILLVVNNYIPYRRAKGLLEFDELETVSLYTYLSDAYGIVATTGRRQIQIAKAEKDIAEILEVPTGDRVLFNREETFDQNGDIVEYYESWHHPERTQLNIELIREQN